MGTVNRAEDTSDNKGRAASGNDNPSPPRAFSTRDSLTFYAQGLIVIVGGLSLLFWVVNTTGDREKEKLAAHDVNQAREYMGREGFWEIETYSDPDGRWIATGKKFAGCAYATNETKSIVHSADDPIPGCISAKSLKVDLQASGLHEWGEAAASHERVLDSGLRLAVESGSKHGISALPVLAEFVAALPSSRYFELGTPEFTLTDEANAVAAIPRQADTTTSIGPSVDAKTASRPVNDCLKVRLNPDGEVSVESFPLAGSDCSLEKLGAAGIFESSRRPGLID